MLLLDEVEGCPGGDAVLEQVSIATSYTPGGTGLYREYACSSSNDAVLLPLCVQQQVVRDTAQAIAEGRSRAQLLHAVAIDKAPSELRALGVSSITDCFTDPCGWFCVAVQPTQLQQQSLATQASSSSSSNGGVQWHDLQLLRQLLQSQALRGGCCLLLAGLSTLLMRHGDMEVC